MSTTVTEKTRKPTGLKISRKNSTFTMEWKIGDKDYGAGQWFDYMINDSGKDNWHKKADEIGTAQTKKSITINKENYYPYKKSNGYFKKQLFSIKMRVKGEQKKYTTGSGDNKKTHNPTVSDWSTKEFLISKPYKPSLSVALDSELTNVCRFSWSVSTPDTGHHIFTNCLLQTMLVKNSTQTDGSKLSWKNATEDVVASSGTRAITEDTAILYKQGNSYTRWVRIKSRGPRGSSDWVYKSHVYALPNQANVDTPSAVETDEGGFRCEVFWDVASNKQNPIDKTTVQYTIVTPNENLTCPSGASWTDANISKDTAKKDGAVFNIDDQLSKDECLFIRVNTQHDSHITYGKPQLAKVGFLKDPTITSVQTDNVTHRATITANNSSEVEDSVLVVRYVPSEGIPFDVGIIAHGQNSVTVQCPDWDDQTAIAFQVYAMVGTATKQQRADNVDSYAINAKMRSEQTVSHGGTVPVAPASISVNRIENTNTVQVQWDWSWAEANGAQLSWANHRDAWESTDEPEMYTISNLHASKWNISDLELGETWYIRVRLMAGDVSGDVVTYGPWSDIDLGVIDLSSTPNKPVLMLSKPVIHQNEQITASWVYTSIDNTPQDYAEIADVEWEENEFHELVPNYENKIAHTSTAQHVTIDTTDWDVGDIKQLACRVRSKAGKFSEWSDLQGVTVAEPIISSVTLGDSFETKTETITSTNVETEQTVTETVSYTALVEMPLEITVEGAGAGGQTSVAVERAETYYLERPDGDEFVGYEGETVLLKTIQGEGTIAFDLGDLLGALDDGASYNIVATVQDELGQQDAIETEFRVNWTKQATKPTADISVDRDYLVTKITPHKSLQANADDVFDIYRLSADKPELIVENGEFGQTYIDPYPTIGKYGGHRIVLKTANGDYITANNELAWYNTDDDDHDIIDISQSIIDFGGDRVYLDHNVELTSKWEKDFQQTKYMGGSIVGDWTVGVRRSGTINTTMITLTDRADIEAMRRLAEYSGICHVRTTDGSSYSADVQVSQDTARATYGMITSFALTVTKVDPQVLDGILLAEWEEEGQDELG